MALLFGDFLAPNESTTISLEKLIDVNADSQYEFTRQDSSQSPERDGNKFFNRFFRQSKSKDLTNNQEVEQAPTKKRKKIIRKNKKSNNTQFREREQTPHDFAQSSN